ncbi:MAG: hypothetical protein Q7U98_17075 [Methylicorpusculum sp.]|nr:hypothetical protein [Methylicorpusculum sp.]MDO8940869.1 hypothetical protein [Methylicorpusculum sp.]MDP2202439.1 hypothetical protein [Methylicorpusculum sp.]
MLVYYPTLDKANEAANARTKQTGRYWTAIRSYYGTSWIITDIYHPIA